MIRQDVLSLLTGEREYQRDVYPDGEGGGSVLREVALLNSYIEDLNSAYRNEPDVDDLDAGLDTLDVLRKIAAIAIRGLERGAEAGYLVPRTTGEPGEEEPL